MAQNKTPFVAKVYGQIKLTEEDWNYEKFCNLTFGDVSKYEVTDKIGRGKYADVFKGVNMETGAEVALKVLHPLTKKKIQREVWVMQKLKDCTSTAKLLEVVRDPGTHSISLVLEYVPSADYRELYPKFTDVEVRQYMFQLFKALDQIHSKGIIHRDIKPHNIAYDPKTKNLKIIDFGLSEFYQPNKPMSVRVASQYFKAPELILEIGMYDFAIDVWAVGCIFASIIFMKAPFFHGLNVLDQIDKIVAVLGAVELMNFMSEYGIEFAEKFNGSFGKHPRRPWERFITTENSLLAHAESIDLLDKLLVYDPSKRLTARDAMQHNYFKNIRAASK